jgi:serine/tyrosine/threonine adenylyltransferase
VFSSIDHRGRYAYGNQPAVAQWNLARLGETLLPLIDADTDAAVAAATSVLGEFADAYQRCLAEGMAAKLGLPAPDPELVADVLELLRGQRVDFTGFFRALAAGTARSLFAEPAPFDSWAARREALLPADRAGVAAAMNRVNPVYVPRNHLVEEALAAATAGDLGPFERLVEVVSAPFVPRPGCDRYAEPAPVGGAPYVTYCGT